MRNRASSYQLAIAAEQNVKEREYWLTKLSGDIGKSTFPYDLKKQDAGDYWLESLKCVFPGELFSASMNLSKGSDARLHIILVTGLFILLSKYARSSDIIIGSPILKQEVECDFINTFLVFRNEFSNDMSFKELLLHVKDTIIDANKNQNYPMEKLLDHLGIQAVENEFPLFGVVVLLENLYDKSFIQHIHYDMSFSFTRAGDSNRGSIEGVIEYNAALYTKRLVLRKSLYFLIKFFNSSYKP